MEVVLGAMLLWKRERSNACTGLGDGRNYSAPEFVVDGRDQVPQKSSRSFPVESIDSDVDDRGRRCSAGCQDLGEIAIECDDGSILQVGAIEDGRIGCFMHIDFASVNDIPSVGTQVMYSPTG